MDNDNIEVSILCLAYNHQKYIKSALDGFIKQKTNFRYEVLINDDASTDETPNIIKEYEIKYPDIIRPVYQKENQYSKNVAIIEDVLLPLAKGKYIAFCEGDDYWTDDRKLQNQYDLLEKHLECSLCVHRVDCENNDGSASSRSIPEEYYKISHDIILDKDDLCRLYWGFGGYPFHTSSYFVRKKVFDAQVVLKRDIGILRRGLLFGSAIYIEKAMSIRRLFTEGNFNNRLKEKGNEGLVWLSMQDIENDLNFDDYTNGEFRPYTLLGVYKNIMRISHYKPELSKELLNKYNVDFFKWTESLHMKDKIKSLLLYLMLKVLPSKLYVKILSIKQKHERN